MSFKVFSLSSYYEVILSPVLSLVHKHEVGRSLGNSHPSNSKEVPDSLVTGDESPSFSYLNKPFGALFFKTSNKTTE